MNKNDVLALLEANQNERGIAHWAKLKKTGGLKSFGIGLTQLRKLAKQVGRNHELAQALWDSDVYDAKVMGLLVDEPKKLTREQVERQVEALDMGMLEHVFSSCDATLAKAKFAVDLAPEWLHSDHEVRKRCAYGLYYELSKNQRNKALTDDYFLECIDKVKKDYDESLPGAAKVGMGTVLMGVGKRNKKLNAICLELAREIGPIDFNDEDSTSKCDPFDVVKHLTSDYLKAKLGLD